MAAAPELLPVPYTQRLQLPPAPPSGGEAGEAGEAGAAAGASGDGSGAAAGEAVGDGMENLTQQVSGRIGLAWPGEPN